MSAPPDHMAAAGNAPPRTLSDAFVAAGAGGPVTYGVPVAAALQHQASMRASAAGWDDDTPWLAAWLLTLSQILGENHLAVLLSDATGARLMHVRLPPDLPGADWLAQVDAARGTAIASAPAEAAALPTYCGVWHTGTDKQLASADAGAIVRCWHEGGATPALHLRADGGLAEPGQLERLLQAVVCAAAALLDTPHQPLRAIAILDAGSLQQLAAWNPPAPPPDATLTVPGRFAQQVVAHADAPAVIWPGGRLSYAELDRLSTRLANRLRASGIGHGDCVAIALGRTGEAIITLLAVLKAGAAYLPVDAGYPAERIQYMLTDAGVRLVIAAPAQRHAFQSTPLMSPEPADAASGAEPNGTPASSTASAAPDGHSLAYVMYTSGSTGTPKGIEIEHQSILRLVLDAGYVGLGPGYRMLHAAPLGFDASTLEVWGPLLNGGCCVLHDEDLPTGRGLARTIRDLDVHSAWLTAALFNAVIDDDPQHLAGLRELLIGGEALSVPHVKRALDALPNLTLINGYGPTECTTFTTTYVIPRDAGMWGRSIPIGRPISDTYLRVLSPSLKPVPIGLVGELFVGGRGLARGYLRRPDLTAERFIADPYAEGQRLYRTGDLVRYLDDGRVEYIGRADTQVKIRGFRIEPGEIEVALSGHAAVRACAVLARRDGPGPDAQLVAYVVLQGKPVTAAALRQHLSAALPAFMVPAHYVFLDALPVTTNGKLDRRALPAPSRTRPTLSVPYATPQGDAERRICAVFAELLGLDAVGRHDNFFELGGNSLRVLAALARLETSGIRLSTAQFFGAPTPAGLAYASNGLPESADAHSERRAATVDAGSREAIAIVAAAGRFPGANDPEAFWDNLCAGRESITFLRRDQLDPSLPSTLTGDPAYVAARGLVDDVDQFDAAFFGISPKEADLMDPQQRVFMELCWECLERAGHAPDRCGQPVGLYAGMYNASYFQRHVQHRPDLIERVGEFQVMLANEKDYIATRIAHRLNLTGPAVSVHTACSTSLVAIAQAVTALRTGQCDMALAGGVAITCPPNSGYLYQEGAMLSPDGHTRSFDADAQGTVFSDGAGVVLLKRLSDAVADGNTVIALIKGTAVNNDGGHKASFTAPSADGQAAVISAALADAGVDARSISYVEAHGTATPLGDPIEVAGLTQAFQQSVASARDGSSIPLDSGSCAIGSLKSNVGHLVIAAGVAGVIKTAYALSHERLPPSLHCSGQNPRIDFAATPFAVQRELAPWPRSSLVRRAGVSSFGVGGTNAHAVLEEAPLPEASAAATGPQLLLLSARTATALAAGMQRLAEHLLTSPDENLGDVAYTLRVGRSPLAQRACVVADDTGLAAERWSAADTPWRVQGAVWLQAPQLVLTFPGQGAHYPGMGSALYRTLPIFRSAIDECMAALRGHSDVDVLACMFDDQADRLTPTAVAQPATFALEYALARCWLALGVAPAALVGHSVGEFVAATLAGVMSLTDAIRLVAQRGRLMQALPAGAMLSVQADADALGVTLPKGLSVAAHNAPGSCVVAGPIPLIEAYEETLRQQGTAARRLQTSHAFHTAMMDGAVAPFEAAVRGIALQSPKIPIYSTATGTLLRDDEATDPGYWSRHLRLPVRYSPALQYLRTQLESPLLLEVGPRQVLTGLARRHRSATDGALTAVASLSDSVDAEAANLRLAAGRLWVAGVDLDLAPLDAPGRRHRLRLPTTAFDRQRHWVDAPVAQPVAAPPPPSAAVISLERILHGSRNYAPPPPADAGAARSEPGEVTTRRPAAGAALMQFPAPDAVSPGALPIPLSEPVMDTSDVSAVGANRRPQLVARLRVLFEEVSGIDLDPNDLSLPFIEQGFDSLQLTQVALQIKKTFQVAVSFRQLMEGFRTLDALATYVDEQLPAEAAAVAAPTNTAPVAGLAALTTALPSGAAAPLPLVQHVIQQQMQLMAQQLALLGMGGSAPPASVDALAAAMSTNLPVPTAAAPPAAAKPTAGDPAPATNGMVSYDVKTAFGAIARIHTAPTEQVSERQQVRLGAFMRRYTERTAKSKAYTQEHRPHLADPRVVNGFKPPIKEIIYQIVIERSQGSKVTDLDGNTYVDVLNGFGMNMFGWSPAFVQDAVRQQLERGYEIGPQHPLAGEVAKALCELTGFDRAGLCNTGSEAVMGAIRIARTVTGRSLIVIFTGSYHGIFDEVIVRGTKKLRSVPAAPGILPNTSENVLVLDYGTPESLQIIRDRAADIAAVMVEPVQSRRPDFQPQEFLQQLREITREAGALYIFDEVVTGFRVHQRGAQGHFGIDADLACYGKVVGGGFPIGVIAGRREYMDALDGGHWEYGDDSIPTVGVTYFAGTFVRHPLALAAAAAVLTHLKERGPELQQTLTRTTTDMVAELNACCHAAGAPVVVKHFGSVWKTFFTEDHPFQDLLFAMMRSRGIHILDNFPCFMTTAHSAADVKLIVDAFRDSLHEMQESDFLPSNKPLTAAVFDASKPPVPGARLGKDPDGKPAWFVRHPEHPEKYLKVNA